MHYQASFDLTPGQNVEIDSGPFAGLEAELIKMDVTQRQMPLSFDIREIQHCAHHKRFDFCQLAAFDIV